MELTTLIMAGIIFAVLYLTIWIVPTITLSHLFFSWNPLFSTFLFIFLALVGGLIVIIYEDKKRAKEKVKRARRRIKR